MGLSSSRSVEIQVVNNTEDITLMKPRIYFSNGHSLKYPRFRVIPGSSSSCKFINNSIFWGCNGVLAYEADSFTLAIYFSNPMDHNVFSMEMGLELSLDKVHRWDLETAYDRLVRISQGSSDSSMFPCVILKDSQDQAQLSAGPVTVTATVSRGRSAVIKVEVGKRGNWGGEAGIEPLVLRTAHQGGLRHYRNSRRTLRTALEWQILLRALQELPENLRHIQNPV